MRSRMCKNNILHYCIVYEINDDDDCDVPPRPGFYFRISTRVGYKQHAEAAAFQLMVVQADGPEKPAGT